MTRAAKERPAHLVDGRADAAEGEQLAQLRDAEVAHADVLHQALQRASPGGVSTTGRCFLAPGSEGGRRGLYAAPSQLQGAHATLRGHTWSTRRSMAAHVSAMGGLMRPPFLCGSVTGQWICA